MLWIVDSSKYVEAMYLLGIKCMIDLLAAKVVKSLSLFNSKLMMFSSITHRIMDVKIYNIGLWVYWIHCYRAFMDRPKVD